MKVLDHEGVVQWLWPDQEEKCPPLIVWGAKNDSGSEKAFFKPQKTNSQKLPENCTLNILTFFEWRQ